MSNFVILESKVRGYFGVFRRNGKDSYDLANLSGSHTYGSHEYWVPIIDTTLSAMLDKAPTSTVFEVIEALRVHQTRARSDDYYDERRKYVETFIQEAL